MSRFLVNSMHARRHPSPWIIEAASTEEIAQRYPVFGEEPIFLMPDERPAWLDDHVLAFAEKHSFYRLGDPEPRSLVALVEHHANGDEYEWYALEERLSDGERRSRGELGSWRRRNVGEIVGKLPNDPAWWRVVAVEPARRPTVAATLVIEQAERDQSTASDAPA